MKLDRSQSYYDRAFLGQLLNGKWPRPGAKLRYSGAHAFWFTGIVEDAENHLVLGEVYTLAKISLASSWVAVSLEETGDMVFALNFFEVASNE